MAILNSQLRKHISAYKTKHPSIDIFYKYIICRKTIENCHNMVYNISQRCYCIVVMLWQEEPADMVGSFY